MIRYIPPFILAKYEQNALQGDFQAFVVLFDIVDFSTSCSTLFQKKKDGAEILSHYLEAAFREPIETLESYGGFVSSFAGDSCTALFPGNSPLEVLSAVKIILAYFKGVKKIQDMKLSIRLIVSYGKVEWRIYPTKHQHEYIFVGQAIDDMVKLQSSKKEVVFSESAALQIGSDQFTSTDNGFLLNEGTLNFKLAPLNKITYEHKTESREVFCHSRFRNAKPKEEYKPAAYCFISLKKIEDSAINATLEEIHALADEYHGLVNKLEKSDKGFLAIVLFGMPYSEGNTHYAICKFALSLMERCPKLSIGISCGFILSCYTGGGVVKEYTAFGYPMNLCARLLGKAHPGEVFTDSYLRTIMDSYFYFTPMGTIPLKGLADPIQISLLTREVSHRDLFKRREFIGRHQELGLINQELIRCINTKTNAIIYISGDAGIGKSRLAKEALQHYSSEKYYNIFISCDTLHRKPLYAVHQLLSEIFHCNPWVTKSENRGIFRGIWKDKAGDDKEMERIESIIASFFKIYWEPSTWDKIKNQNEKIRNGLILNAFVYLMKKLAEKTTFLIHLDDAQWMDSASLAYFQELSKENVCPFIIVAPCRYEGNKRVELNLINHERIDIDLGEMEDMDRIDFIQSLIRSDIHVPEKTTDFILSKAQGVPLFIEQLTLSLMDRNRIDDKGNITDTDGYNAALGIRDVIDMRIDNLTEHVRKCLYNAAVLGKIFHVEVLSRMLDTTLLAELESGEQNRIWRRYVDGVGDDVRYQIDELQYIFSHIMIKECAYDRMMRDTLLKMHFAAAIAMERVFSSSLEEHAAEIALHMEKAEQFAKAAYYYNLAGSYYRAKYDFTSATLNFEKALELRETPPNCPKPDCKNPEIAETLHEWAELLIMEGKLDKAQEFLTRALSIRKERLGKKDIDTAATLNLQANLYFEADNYREAETFYKQALAIRQKCLSDDDPLLAETMHDMANLYFKQGDFPKAEPLFEKAIAIRQNFANPENPELADSLNDLARLYAQIDREAEALQLFNTALQMRETTLGEDHVDITETLTDLASYYIDHDQFNEAEPLLQRALNIRRNTLGNDHPLVAESLDDLGRRYLELDNFPLAQQYFDDAMSIRRKTLGSDHIEFAESKHNLAELYLDKGLWDKAEEYVQKALEIRQRILPAEHHDIADSLNLLANIYSESGKNKEAGELYEQVSKMREKIYGSQHSELAETFHDQAQHYMIMGKYEEAEKLFLRSLEIRVKTLEPENLDVAESLQGLGECYREQGLLEKAENLHSKALAIKGKTLGSDHTDLADSYHDLANTYVEQKKYQQAEDLFLKAKQIREKAFGKDNHEYADTLNDLARLYQKQGNFKKSEQHFKDSLKIKEAKLQPNHHELAETYHDLGCLYHELNKVDNAKDYYNKALAIRSEQFGEDNPETQETLSALSALNRG